MRITSLCLSSFKAESKTELKQHSASWLLPREAALTDLSAGRFACDFLLFQLFDFILNIVDISAI
ncbi:MAG: hypothetical protein ACE5JM_14650 [Armatimonadota bacterium]